MERHRQRILHESQKSKPTPKQGDRGDDMFFSSFVSPPKPKTTPAPVNTGRVFSAPNAKRIRRNTVRSASSSGSDSPDALNDWEDIPETSRVAGPSQARLNGKHLYPPSSPDSKLQPRRRGEPIIIEDSGQDSPVKRAQPKARPKPNNQRIDSPPRTASFSRSGPSAPQTYGMKSSKVKTKAMRPAPFPLALTGSGAASKDSSACPIMVSDDGEMARDSQKEGFPMQLTPAKSSKSGVSLSGSISLGDDDDDDIAKKPAPFPMSEAQLADRSIIANGSSRDSPYNGFRPPTSEASSDNERPLSLSSSSSSKRILDSDAEGPRTKRRRRDREVLSVSLEKSLHRSVGRRTPSPPPSPPSKLCAFCDEPFPPKPSKYLQNILQSLLSKSWPAPRSSNPLGRDAPLAVSINLCTAHRAESATIPAGVEQGWPLKIDFDDVKRRVQSDRIRKKLNAILMDKVKGAHGGQRGIFWDAARRDVEVRGARVANSVQGQMQTFEETQPGYYGEKGFLVISSTLQAMFPSDEVDPGTTYPLEPPDFLRRVLLPEAAVLLIMEDRKIDRDDALMVLKASRAFGLAAFPVRDGEIDTGNASFNMTPSPMVVGTLGKGKGKQRADDDDQDERSTRRPVSPTLGKGKSKAASKVEIVLKSSSAWLLDDDNDDELEQVSPKAVKAKLSRKVTETELGMGTQRPKKKIMKDGASISQKKNVFDQSSSESEDGSTCIAMKDSSRRAQREVMKSTFSVGNGNGAKSKVTSPPAFKPGTRSSSKASVVIAPVTRMPSQKRNNDDLEKRQKVRGSRPTTFVADTDEEEDYLKPVTIPTSKPNREASMRRFVSGSSATKVVIKSKNANVLVRHPTAISAQRRDSPEIERSSGTGIKCSKFSEIVEGARNDEHLVISSPEERGERKDKKRYKDAGEDLSELRQMAVQDSSRTVSEEQVNKRIGYLSKLRAGRKKR
ncbi:hypothetical protein FRB95_005400 [Tulasnella sp. JGI-2019a]|nr:hypothetical protein FRB95_005400 [Tulasnella sp. JGI-2019a]